jgi:MYXO-CTERM domain-containing protein
MTRLSPAVSALRAGHLSLAVLLAGVTLPHPQAQAAPAVSTVLALSGSRLDDGVIVGPGGSLYGASVASTSSTSGLIFRVAPDGSQVETLYQLGENDGRSPQGALLLGSDGQLYGTTQFSNGGFDVGAGTVFRVAADGSGFTTLFNFAPSTTANRDSNPINTNGAQPNAALIEGKGSIEGSDDLLYGVARTGGPGGTGAVYKIARDGSGFALLHTFAAITSTSGTAVNADGTYPRGALVESAGYFYGTTTGGGANSQGTVFRLRFDGSEFQVLHVFSATTTQSGSTVATNEDGGAPVAGLIDGGDGFLYGTTNRGGANGAGTIFSMTPDGTLLTMHDFLPDDGAQPQGGLLLASDGSRLYGTTFSGGTTSAGASSSLGTIFSIAPDGSGFTKLYSFDGTNGSNGVGRMVQLSATEFVGTAANGGSCGGGTIFRLSLSGATIPGDNTCGNTGGGSGGGGALAPGLLGLLGLVGLARRRRREG